MEQEVQKEIKLSLSIDEIITSEIEKICSKSTGIDEKTKLLLKYSL
jgi:hypothetical protein